MARERERLKWVLKTSKIWHWEGIGIEAGERMDYEMEDWKMRDRIYMVHGAIFTVIAL